MKTIRIRKVQGKYVIVCLQVLLLLAAVSSWLLNRNNAYEKEFTPDEYHLSESAVMGEQAVIDDTMGEAGIFLSTQALTLQKGVYQIQIAYSACSEGNSVFVSSGLGPQEMFAPSFKLSPSSYSASMPLEITRGTDDVVIQIYFSGSGYLNVAKIGIYETSHRYKKNMIYALFLGLLLGLGYMFKQADLEKRKLILALTGIFCISCYPLYMDYMVVGHDLPFHLLRIDAISYGLSTGCFPVKIHPLWAKGQGYAVGIFYGDAFLYFPAMLRLFGFSVQATYKIFLAAINLGTVLCSYYAFKKMFSSERIGLLGSVVYTLALYRLIDVYTRASVGEYTAMMTLPLVLCGFYMMLGNKREKTWMKYSVMTALGLSGLIQSHVLSCLMVGFVILIACVLLIRRIFAKYVFRALISTAALTLLLNLNFIIPFLDFYQEDILINSPDWKGSTVGTFQSEGLFPIQLFTLFQRSNGGAWPTTAGIFNEPTMGIGIMLTAGILLFLYLLCIYHKECRKEPYQYKAAILCMLLGIFSLFMCTCYFPWDFIASLGSQAKSIVYSLEFPWRMLAPATVLLTFVTCFAFDVAGRAMAKQFGMLFIGCMVLFAVNCGWYFYDYAFTGEPYRVYDTHELDTMQMYSYDFLPAGTNPRAITENAVYAEGVALLEGYSKLGTNITCDITATSDGGYVEFPLLYYKYYRCVDTNTSEELSISAGTNNMVHVELPGGYTGSIKVSFREPWFWRLGEAISFLTLASIILLWVFSKIMAGYFKQNTDLPKEQETSYEKSSIN